MVILFLQEALVEIYQEVPLKQIVQVVEDVAIVQMALV